MSSVGSFVTFILLLSYSWLALNFKKVKALNISLVHATCYFYPLDSFFCFFLVKLINVPEWTAAIMGSCVRGRERCRKSEPAE